MFDGTETEFLVGEHGFGGRVLRGGGLERGFSGCEGEVVMEFGGWEGGTGMGGRVKGLGKGAGKGVLGGGDELVDFVGDAPFWGGVLGRKACGVDGMGDGEQILVGEMGAAGSFGE